MKDDPFKIFELWFDEAKKSGEDQVNACALATATRDGKPHIRFVLLKDVRDGAFHFFTNYQSRKGSDLELNPQASLAFLWKGIYRQIRIEGRVEKLSAGESDAYWKTRDRESQIGGRASPQSQRISSREDLDERVEVIRKEFEGKDIPRPEYWGGYRLIAERIEFWMGRKARLHDREEYVKNSQGLWDHYRLAP